MQETKCQVEGSLKLDGFVTYEHLRSKGEGGGVALCARTELSPAFVRDSICLHCYFSFLWDMVHLLEYVRISHRNMILSYCRAPSVWLSP